MVAIFEKCEFKFLHYYMNLVVPWWLLICRSAKPENSHYINYYSKRATMVALWWLPDVNTLTVHPFFLVGKSEKGLIEK